MVFGQNIEQALLAAILLLVLPAQAGASPEPLVVTRLSDPDPNFVAVREVSAGKQATAGEIDADARIDAAMQNFGRAMGQAAIVEQQQIEELCRSGQPATPSLEQRFDFQASCRYSRH